MLLSINWQAVGYGESPINFTEAIILYPNGTSISVILENGSVTVNPPSYTITTASNPPEGGTTTGGGTYNQGTDITITAIEDPNWLFENWTEDGTVVSTEAQYTFTIEADRDFVANFIVDPFYTDSLALVALYNDTDGDNWTNHDNWLEGPVNEWFGIEVEDGRVTSIHLAVNQLIGNIPECLGVLSNLEDLILWDNQISGSIPESLGNLSSMVGMFCGGNQLSGGIPESLGNLSNLESLSLAGNQLSGSIPESLGDLSNLISIRLQNNQLTGSIPENLGNLSNLESLSCSGNQLSGSIPGSFGNLNSLEYLFLSNNQLTGNIPESLGNLSNLTSLILRLNQITGSIPESLGNLNNLTYIYLDNNLLEGVIPMSICTGLQNLNKIQLNNNNFSSESCAVIQCLIDRGLNTLEHSPQNDGFVFMEGCQSTLYSDSLVLVELYNATNGSAWNNHENWLEEPVNLWHGITVENDRVVQIDLSGPVLDLGNFLFGSLPPEIGNLDALEVLDLSGNEFLGGGIPENIDDLISLTYLDLSDCKIGGSIPQTIGNLALLSYLDLTQNLLSGTLPESIGSLSSLEFLSLKNNQLTGSIPASFGNLSNLTELYFNSNLLESQIPLSICNNLPNLTKLKLNNNNFGIDDCPVVQCLIDRGGWSTFDHSPQNDDFDFLDDCVPPCQDAMANAGDDALICENETFQLMGQAENYISVLWETTGDGTFDNATALETSYHPHVSDIAAGFAQLCLTAYAEEPCEYASDCLVLEILPLPFVDAGPDLTICEDQTADITQSIASNYSAIFWTTSGDGVFSNPNLLSTSYEPGFMDLANGSVELLMLVEAINPCIGSATDAMTITIVELPTIDIGSDQTICEDGTVFFSGLIPGLECNLLKDGYPFYGNMYTPTSGDITAGSVEFCMVCEPPEPCESEISDCLTIYIQQSPSVDAGENQTIVAGMKAYLDASAENYSELEWQTNGDGFFDDEILAAAIYTPGIQDFENGSVQLTVFADPESPCMYGAMDEIIIFCVAPVIDLGPDETVCEDVEYLHLPGNVGQGMSMWSYTSHTAGDGTYDSVNPVPISLPWTVGYHPGPNDLESGYVEMCLTFHYDVPPGYSVSDCKTFYFQSVPIVDAGEDISIPENGTASLDAIAENYSSLLWLTEGDGSFDNVTSPNTNYTPGAMDISSGSAQLCLQAEPINPCFSNSSDCLTLTINPAGEITNVTAAQRNDGSGLVDVSYDLEGTETNYDVILEISLDNGSNYQAANHVTGAIGAVAPAAGLEIIWDLNTEFPEGIFNENMKVKVRADIIWDCGDILTDPRDGQEYETVQIGDQCWMAENLKYLPAVNPSGEGSNYAPYYYVYDYAGTNISDAKASNNYQNYGALYNWPAASISCPDNWHLPTDTEWTVLTNYLGGTSVAGGKMKSTRTDPDPHPRWYPPNEGATNSSGFTGLPGGNRSPEGIFSNLTGQGYWWSSTSAFSTNAWIRNMNYISVEANRTMPFKNSGLSVRCIMD